MHFKIDENLPADSIDIFSSAGMKASTVLEEGLGGRDDSRIAHVCGDEKKVLVTLDLDFADLRDYPPKNYPGIIVLRLERQDKKNVMRTLEKVVRLCEKEEVLHRLWIVGEDGVRVRQ